MSKDFKSRMHKSKEDFDKHKSEQHAFNKLSLPEQEVERQRAWEEREAKRQAKTDKVDEAQEQIDKILKSKGLKPEDLGSKNV